jgi:hypothetical protein
MVLAPDPSSPGLYPESNPPPYPAQGVHYMIRVRILAAAVALTLGTVVAPIAIQAANAAAPVILQSTTTATTLTIDGSNLGPGVASVILGSFGPLTVVSQTANQLVLALPAELHAGNYVLSVQIGNGGGNFDESVVTVGTVGATGPAGPAGPQGVPGPAGPAGATGPAGPQGPAGPEGPMGATGPQGATGATGPQGPAGDSGQSVSVTQLSVGNANCPNGGAALTVAGVTAYVCSPSGGSTGGGGGGGQVQPAIGNATIFAQVNGWAALPAANPWTLCYKATRDNVASGFISFQANGAFQFHAKCDNRGATFFVAKTSGGVVFGGYTAVAWTGECTTRSDPAAFLFSVTNNFKHAQTGPFTDSSTYDCVDHGPTFGALDFWTNLSTDVNVLVGWSYACRVGELGSYECINDFAGGQFPDLLELEVYAAQ